MEFNVTREQWLERFVMRLSQLEVGAEPDDFAAVALRLWPVRGQLAPEAVAEAEAVDRKRAHPFGNSGPDTQCLPINDPESQFERTQRIPVERLQAEGEYVRDNDEWIARCVARVLELDPIIKADEARRSVADLSALERWRLMKPEAAADQLYTPIRPRPS
ncbi:MAG: hypothetical protein ABI281_06685 [Caldimonas sp.]